MDAETNIPPGKKILVVDDDQIILKTLTIALSCKGYQVLTAIDGPGAINIVSRDRPDLILLDINFPARCGECRRGAPGRVFSSSNGFAAWAQLKTFPLSSFPGTSRRNFKKRAQAAKVVGFFPNRLTMSHWWHHSRHARRRCG
jgi:CheY-like chemotaxis protein